MRYMPNFDRYYSHFRDVYFITIIFGAMRRSIYVGHD